MRTKLTSSRGFRGGDGHTGERCRGRAGRNEAASRDQGRRNEASFVLTPLTSGAIKPDAGLASFCCWTERHIVRNGQAVEINNPKMTLTGKRGTLVARNKIGYVDLPDGGTCSPAPGRSSAAQAPMRDSSAADAEPAPPRPTAGSNRSSKASSAPISAATGDRRRHDANQVERGPVRRDGDRRDRRNGRDRAQATRTTGVGQERLRTSPAFLRSASRRERPRPAGWRSLSAFQGPLGPRSGTCMPTDGSSGRSGHRPATPRSSRKEQEGATRAMSSSGSPSVACDYCGRRSSRPAYSSTTGDSRSLKATPGTRFGEVIEWCRSRECRHPTHRGPNTSRRQRQPRRERSHKSRPSSPIRRYGFHRMCGRTVRCVHSCRLTT